MAAKWIEHDGKQILFIDFIGCNSEQKMIANLEKTVEMYNSTPGKVLSLWDFTDSYISFGFIAKAKELAPIVFNHKRKKSAVYGLTPVKKVILNGYNKYAQEGLKPFDTKEEALDYLME